MHATPHVFDARHDGNCVELSKRMRWEIERDVMRDFWKKFLLSVCRSVVLLVVAPFMALVYLIFFPVIGLGLATWMAAKACCPAREKRDAPQDVTLFERAQRMRTEHLGSRVGRKQLHIRGSALATASRAVALVFITVAAGFFLSATITIYGGFPLWFV